MSFALAENYLPSDIPKINSLWTFDTNDGVVGYRDVRVPYSSGKSCIKVLTTQNNPPPTLFYLAGNPQIQNYPFSISNSGQISFALQDNTKPETLEISINFLQKGYSIVFYTHSSQSGKWFRIINDNMGIYFQYSSYAIITLASVSYSSLGIDPNNIWLDIQVYIKAEKPANDWIYKFRFKIIQVNYDITTRQYISDTLLWQYENLTGINTNGDIFESLYFTGANLSGEAKIDYIRVFQGIGVSEI